jgi:hypothetical protein
MTEAEKTKLMDELVEEAGRKIGEIIRRESFRTGKTRREVLAEASEGGKKERFGTMPDEYDPNADESHPSKGWKG